jgi:hypothetical protein
LLAEGEEAGVPGLLAAPVGEPVGEAPPPPPPPQADKPSNKTRLNASAERWRSQELKD